MPQPQQRTEPEVAAPVRVTWSGTVASITLNRPERGNALDDATTECLIAALDRAAAEDCTMAVLSGTGRHFCTGFDLDGLEGMSDGDLLRRFVRIETLLQALHHAPFPVLCLAQGNSFGAGVDILCACSDRIADPGARFRMPGWRFGLALGTRRLAARIGAPRARDVLAAAREFSAAEAVAWGLLDGTAAQADWPAETERAAARWTSIDGTARAQLMRMTAPDTRAADMADLATSASRPGLKERIMAYRSQRARTGSRREELVR